MSTEQKPAATDPNALASGLSTGWEKFKQGRLISYPMMALILVVVTAIGVGGWIWNQRRNTESGKWVELDKESTAAGLEEFAKKYPNTVQGRIANLELARTQLGPDGIDKLNDPATRKAAIASVEKAREAFEKLADEFKNDLSIRVECMHARARAEAALVGMPKEGQLEQRHGDPAKAIEWLDKVAEAAPDTPLGKSDKKLADTLRNQNTQQQVVTLQSSVYDLSPTLGKFDPKMPFDPSHGFPGFPGGP